MPRRRRASGVRRSCETPASSTARSCSICRRLPVIALKPRLTARDLGGPALRQRCAASSPRPTRATAVASSRSGRARKRANTYAATSSSASTHQRPHDRPRRELVGGRARRHGHADPVRHVRRDDADEQHLRARREANLRLRAESFAQPFRQFLHQRPARRLPPHRSLGFGKDPHAVVAGRAAGAFRGAAGRRPPRAPRGSPAAARASSRSAAGSAASRAPCGTSGCS